MTGQRLLLESRVLQLAIDAPTATWQRRAMAAAQPFALGPAEGRVIDLGDFGMTVKASEAETAGVHAIEIVGPPSEPYV